MTPADYASHAEYVRAVYYALPPEYAAALVNGVGSQLPLLKYINMPRKYRELFHEPGNLHDMGYILGGNSTHRKACDNAFFVGCVSLSGFDARGLWWSFTGWRAVRWGGDLPVLHSWEHRKAPLSYADVFHLAKHRLEA